MFRRVTASRRLPSFSGPTVLTIVASTSAVAATVVMFSTEFAESVLTFPNASPDAIPSKPIEPSAAAVVLTRVRRVCADSCLFCSSIVSKRWFSTSDMWPPRPASGAHRPRPCASHWRARHLPGSLRRAAWRVDPRQLARVHRVEANGRAGRADAIAELGGEPVADEHSQRLRHARNVAEPGLQLLDVDQARMGFEDRAEDRPLGEVVISHPPSLYEHVFD